MNSQIDLIYREWQEAIRDRYNIKGEQVVVAKPSNPAHLSILKEMCLGAGFTSNQANSIILILEKEIDDEETIKYRDEEGDSKEMKAGAAKKLEKDHPAKKEYDRLKGQDGDSTDIKKQSNPNYAQPGKKPEPGQSTIDGSHHTSQKSQKEKETKSKEELQQKDHEITDDTLVYTKSQAKKDQDTGGREGVGLGTDVSRAGEAAVHKGLRMLQKGDSIDEVYSLLKGVAEEKDTFLTNEWVDAAVSSIKSIQKEIGIENIENVAWDTDEGRESIGVDTKLSTSADMFVRTKDGENIGLSLKDSGDVFLANGGWNEQSTALLNDLENQMPETEHQQLKQAMSIETFKENRVLSFQNVLNQLGSKGLEQMIKNIQDDESKPIGKYIDKLSDVPSLMNKIETGNLSGDEMKGIAKMLKVSDKELEKTLRGPEQKLVKDSFDVLNSSIEAKRGMNKWILKNMHVFDTLGLNKNLKDGGVDKFMTVFGSKPDGSVMKEDSIRDLFGEGVVDLLNENLDEIKAGNATSKELEDYMADRMDLDHETGRINFRHENNLKYPLFYLAGRTRGIGTAPVLEIHSTPMFERSLEAGTFNTDEWSPEQMKRLKGDFKKAAQRADDKLKADN